MVGVLGGSQTRKHGCILAKSRVGRWQASNVSMREILRLALRWGSCRGSIEAGFYRILLSDGCIEPEVRAPTQAK